MNNISVKYIYSACVLINTPNVSILCDPWFTEGIYDGSWYHYPRIKDPIKSIGNVDYIYVSHIHPDHYDPIFLKEYFEYYGPKKILIADHTFNHLKNKILSDGFKCEILKDKFSIGSTDIQIFPHVTGSLSDIDSALLAIFDDGKKIHKVLNCNDIVFNDDFLNYLKSIVGDIDILLIGHTGAGPYPQCYFDITDPQLIDEANIKKNIFIDRYLKNTAIFNAKVNIPFAGKYILGGKLATLNKYRGVSDPVEILQYDKNAIVLADNGGCINTETLTPSQMRLSLYDQSDIDKYIQMVKAHKLSYENFISEQFQCKIPLIYLIRRAFSNAIQKSEMDLDYYICIKIYEQYFVINCNKNKHEFYILNLSDTLPEPRSEYSLDPRYLFGLLTKVFHWNNAEVGSHLVVRRQPNVYNKKVINFMNFLSV